MVQDIFKPSKRVDVKVEEEKLMTVGGKKKASSSDKAFNALWWVQQDLNLRQPGYEPGALTN